MDANTALNGGDANAALNGSLAGNMQAARGRYQIDLNAEQKDMQPGIDRYRATASQPTPAVPEPKKAAPAPDAGQFQKDSQGWVSAIAALSALVGARGRARGTGALKAFSAGMEGIQKGNQQAFDNAYKTWKANTDAMMDEHKQEMDKYKAIMDNRELTEKEAFDEIKMVGYEHQNKLIMDAKDFEQTAGIYESAVKAQIGAQTYIDKLDAKAKEQQKIQQEQMEKYSNDPGMKGLVKAYLSGVPISALVKGWGGDAQAKAQAIQDMAQRENPDFDWATAHNQYMAQGSELRGIGTMAGKIELGGQLLEKSIPSMLAAAEKVGLTPSTDLNAVYETMLRHASSQDFQNFSTQLRATTSDYALFLGRGRQTVHSDQEALRILNETMGITSLKGFQDAVSAERNNTSAAIGALLKAPATANTAPAATPAGGAAPDYSHLWGGGE